MDTLEQQKREDANTFKILVSSDNHLGYKERDEELADDSFRVFDEVL